MMPSLGELFGSVQLGVIEFLIVYILLSIRAMVERGYLPHIFYCKRKRILFHPRWCVRLLVFCLDALAMFSAFTLLTLYDCGVLGGKMRLPHLIFSSLGGVLSYILFRKALLRPISFIFCAFFEIWLLVFDMALYPFRLLFRLVFRLLFRLLLLWRKKYDKMKTIKKIKRFTQNQLKLAGGAFLTSAMTANDL